MHVTLLAAQSLDGFITQHDTPGSTFTSEADKKHFRDSLGGFDCSVMGGETYRVSRDLIRSHLTKKRLRLVLTRAPDAYAADAQAGTLEFTKTTVTAMVDHLRQRAYQRCALLGGAQLHTLFLQAGLVDELWITVEPVLYGRGTPFLARQGEFRLRLLEKASLSDDVLLLKYQVKR